MRTSLLIVGAGPFGLAIAAFAKRHKVDHMVLGKPMQFWKENMPAGMLLRSGCEWRLDPFDQHTIKQYLRTQGLEPRNVLPLSLPFYLGYTEWFQEQKQIEADPRYVQQLKFVNGQQPHFEAALDDGAIVVAERVVLAPGFRHFKHLPNELGTMFPEGRYSHTCDLVDFAALRGKRCLIVGGRQSAFEWAALLREAGAAMVHVCYRHATPRFAESDWSWVGRMMNNIVESPGWFHSLSKGEQEEVRDRFWAEGRLKLEPWLAPRIRHENIVLWPSTRVVGCKVSPARELDVELDTGQQFAIDHVVFATGYKVDLQRIPYLQSGNIMSRMAIEDGYPVLDETFQTSLPGLFITSMPATRDFGPFFAFTVSVRASARIIGQAIQGRC